MDSMQIFEVRVVEYEKTRTRVHTYKCIKVEQLNKKRLADFYFGLHFKNLPEIVDLPLGFLIQYRSKPAILINRNDGRLYSFAGKWDIREIEHQASLVLRVLSAYDLVEEWQRKSVMKKRK